MDVPAIAKIAFTSEDRVLLRPLLVVEIVGAGAFGAVNALLQRSKALVQAVAPLFLGVAVTTCGWSTAWSVSIAWFGIAAACYLALHVVSSPSSKGSERR